MNHRAFVRSLTRDQRRDLDEKRNLPGLLYLAGHWGGIAGLAWLVVARVPFWPVLMLPLGILIVFQFTLLHETVHRTAFATLWINKVVARVCGFLIFLPSEWFRYFHFAHHRYTQDPENDPELAAPRPATPWRYARHLSGLFVWIDHAKTLVRNAMGRCDDAFVPDRNWTKIAWESRALLVVYAGIATACAVTGWIDILYLWIVPVLLGQPFLRLYLLAEHGRCPFVADMFENTRTTFTNLLVRALAWNMPYHTEHHAVPTVPFHRLPDLHHLMLPHLRVTSDGYVAFHREYSRSMTSGT